MQEIEQQKGKKLPVFAANFVIAFVAITKDKNKLVWWLLIKNFIA